jgi:four helix bundle protein
MSKVQRFEDLIAWQKARALAVRLYQVTGEGPFLSDPALRGQVRRSACSIMANLAEGFERGKMTEFHQYVSIAKGSCAELRSHLYLAGGVGYLQPSDLGELMKGATELGKILGALRAAVARKRAKPAGK